jgi:pimeloyl-ACP methyl ester carboxylesterase
MSTFLLVPGGFLGGWSWQRLTRLLRSQGHDAHAMTLTGLGDRAHLGAPGLHDHVVDVLATIEAEDLRDLVLVGHSYGGVVITAVAAHAPERLGHLVYVDAVVPHDGQSNADAMRDLGAAAMVDAIEADAARRGDGDGTRASSAVGHWNSRRAEEAV